MSDIRRRNILQQDFLQNRSDCESVDEESTQSILDSVRKQEEHFALLTKEIDNERKTCAKQLKNNKGLQRKISGGSFNGTTANPTKHDRSWLSYSNNNNDSFQQTEIFIDQDGVPRVIPVADDTTEQQPRCYNKYSSNASTHSMSRDSRLSSSTLTGALRNPSSVINSNPSVQPEQIQVEDYGLEDDRSDNDEDVTDYGLTVSNAKRPASHSSDDSEARYQDQVKDASMSKPLRKFNHYSSAPLAIHEVPSRRSLDRIGKDWKLPTLEEVIAMLSYNVEAVQENATAFIQHICYGDDEVKRSVRKLGGIYPLIKLLNSDKEKIVWNACGALRNISYGRRNDKNKLKMMQYDAVPALVRVIRSCPDSDMKEQATGALLNLSAHSEVKSQILELGLEVLAKHVIAPYATMTSDVDSKLEDILLFDVFVNAVAIVRNLSSSDSSETRKRIRQCDQLLHSIISVLRINSETGDIDNKASEHCVCILRNLTYKLQVETPDWTLYASQPLASKDSIVSDFFRFKKKPEKGSSITSFERIQDNPFARNAELLWQPSIAHLYVRLLEDSSDYHVIEALLGSIQNLTHGAWKWAAYTRYAVRIEKGLPVILDCLVLDNDDLVRSAAITLSNLAEDLKNKQLIGKYGMAKLIKTLPATPGVECSLSESTMIAILHCMRCLVTKDSENVKSFSESGGVEKILSIKNGNYHPKILRACEMMLLVMWSHKASKSYLKKQGWNRAHFAISNHRKLPSKNTEGVRDDVTGNVVAQSE